MARIHFYIKKSTTVSTVPEVPSSMDSEKTRVSTVRKIAFAVQDAQSVILDDTWVDSSSGNTFSRKQGRPTKVVHWSSQPRDGSTWKAEDNNNPAHWSYTFVDLDNFDSAHTTISFLLLLFSKTSLTFLLPLLLLLLLHLSQA